LDTGQGVWDEREVSESHIRKNTEKRRNRMAVMDPKELSKSFFKREGASSEELKL
jgi:hypothetical protein